MRHRKTVHKLGRTAAHRKALLANLSMALFKQKHIKTTEAKAKAARQFTEKLITLAKKETVHARRIAYSRLRDRKTVQLLFDEIAPRFADRNGGYTRVIKLGQRHGDAAPMAILELVGFETASKKKKVKEEKAKAAAAAAEGKASKPKKAKEKTDDTPEEVVQEAAAEKETEPAKKVTKKKAVKEKSDKEKK
ncbi:50S ribosomal protein L17 [bacterium]|nr:50S ribosomal protein L17 [bacterium]